MIKLIIVIIFLTHWTYVSALEGLESDGARELLREPFSRIPASHKEQLA